MQIPLLTAQDPWTAPWHVVTMDRIGNIAGRLWIEWQLERAEEIDAGRPEAEWKEPRAGDVATAARGVCPAAREEQDRQEKVMREATRMPLIRVGTASRAARWPGDRKRADGK